MEHSLNASPSILTAHGRMSRGRYWLIWLICVAFSITVQFLLSMYVDGSQKLSITLAFMVSLFLVIQGIKRMHDTGRSGWFIAIPFYNLVLAFTEGVEGENEYGPDPKNPENVGLYGETQTLDAPSRSSLLELDQERNSNDRQGMIYFLINVGFTYLTWLTSTLFYRLRNSDDHSGFETNAAILNGTIDFVWISMVFVLMGNVKSKLARNAFFVFMIIKLVIEFINIIPITGND